MNPTERKILQVLETRQDLSKTAIRQIVNITYKHACQCVDSLMLDYLVSAHSGKATWYHNITELGREVLAEERKPHLPSRVCGCEACESALADDVPQIAAPRTFNHFGESYQPPVWQVPARGIERAIQARKA